MHPEPEDLLQTALQSYQTSEGDSAGVLIAETNIVTCYVTQSVRHHRRWFFGGGSLIFGGGARSGLRNT